MSLVTVIIPVSPEHRQTGVYLEAQQSVLTQTMPTVFITEFDEHKRGAAYTRNQATRRVTTPFVIWLDADDLLRPTFVEQCLKIYRRGTFVYTDWVIDGIVRNTPDCLRPLEIGQEHLITTLMPLAAWRVAGGFDETLDTLEDEDFFRRLYAYSWCGVRCPYPLVEYRRHLGFSAVNRARVSQEVQRERVTQKQALFIRRYQRYAMVQRDCNCSTPQLGEQPQAAGERGPNDVLAEALYTPQRQQGPVTGRLYPRAGLQKPLWVHVDDARTRPDLWRIVAENPDKVSPDVATVQRLVKEAIAQEAVKPDPAPTPARRKCGKRRNAQSNPVS